MTPLNLWSGKNWKAGASTSKVLTAKALTLNLWALKCLTFFNQPNYDYVWFMTDDDEELKMMTGILRQRKCCVYTVPLTHSIQASKSVLSSWSADWNRGQATFPRFSWFQLYSLGFSVELGLWTKELMWEKDMRTPHLLATVRCFILQIFRFEGFETSSLQITAVTGFSFALLEACPVLRHLKGASNASSHSRHSCRVCFLSCLSRCATRWASFGSSISWSHACASCQRWVRQIEGPEKVYSGKHVDQTTYENEINMHDVSWCIRST